MNLRKRLLSAVVLGAMAWCSLLVAQENKGRGAMNPEAMVARLDEAVSLTADQKTKATEIYSRMQEQVRALPKEERRAKMTEVRESTNKEIRALLTDEQKEKFDAMPRPGRGGGAGKRKKSQ